VMRSVEACLVIQAELSGVVSNTKSASKLSALANAAGVGEADLGRALAQLSGPNSDLAPLSHAPSDGGISKRAAKKARAIARAGATTGGTLNFVKKLQSAQPSFWGNKGDLLKTLNQKYDAIDASLWAKRLKLISDNVKLGRQEHAEYFKLDRVQVEPGRSHDWSACSLLESWIIISVLLS